MTKIHATFHNEWEQMRASKDSEFNFQNKTKQNKTKGQSDFWRFLLSFLSTVQLLHIQQHRLLVNRTIDDTYSQYNI